MAMQLKMDEQGHVVVKDGKAVYVDDTDGKELIFDPEQMKAKITELNAEAKQHRLRAKEVEEQLAKFGDVDPDEIENFLTTLEELGGPEGLEKLKSGADVDLDSIKRAITDSYEAKMASLVKSYDTKLGESTEQLTSKDAKIRSLLIGNGFATSRFLNEKTTLPTDIGEAMFGKHFRIEDDKVVAYLGDDPIYSRERHGEPASIDEALEVIVNAYPMKDRILKSAGGGSGAQGGGSQHKGLGAGFDNLSPTQRLTAARAAGITT